MKPRLLALVLAASLLAGCATLQKPPRQAELPVPVPAATPAVSPAETARAELTSLIEQTQDAAARGSEADYSECELATLQALNRWSTTLDSDPAMPLLAGEVMDELDRLNEQMQPIPDELEPPPEPAPVTPEQIAQAQEKAREKQFDLPVIVNAEVTSLVDFYTGPYRDRLVAALERASHLLPGIREELRRAHMPLDLAYLPLVESAFNTRARSRARAQGLWQFIAGTGKLYGLRSDGVVEERNDPYLATKAAISHLADLKAMFGSWELALAAYNSGPGRVERAIRRSGGQTDFWAIRRYLPRETRNYVPALWAALLVAKNPTDYGLPVFPEQQACVGRIEVYGPLDIDVLAEAASLDADHLAEINPALVRRVTPMKGSYLLAVPCGAEEKTKTALASIPPDKRIRRLFHTIVRGDTLGAIARRYGVSVATIESANQIRNHRALRIGQTLVIPRYPTAPATTTAASRSSRKASSTKVAKVRTQPSKQAERQRYVVRRGDTLAAIARRFGTSVEKLQRRNRLGGTTIRPGDVLLMP